jgi:Helix-turn-helix domain
MSDAEVKPDDAQPLTGRRAALADIAERRRKDPNWAHGRDPTYSGPNPAFVEFMNDAEFDRAMAGIVERRQLAANPYPPREILHRAPQQQPRPEFRAALPFGQRIRALRRALRWTQGEIARQLGVSARSIIRYEQGRSSPLQAGPLLALRRLESAYAQQLDAHEAAAERERG